MHFNSRIFILPGLGSSGPGHWQSVWEKEHPEFTRIDQQDWETPVCEDWISHLNEVLGEKDLSDVILVGHSLACSTIAFWAGKYKRTVKGALLVAPSDTEAESYPTGTSGFSPFPLDTLIFPTIVVTSTDDRYVTVERVTAFADAWGSRLINVGKAGHINTEAGFGEWNEGLALLKELD